MLMCPKWRSGNIEAGGHSSINIRRQRSGDTGVTGSGVLNCYGAATSNSTVPCGGSIPAP